MKRPFSEHRKVNWFSFNQILVRRESVSIHLATVMVHGIRTDYGRALERKRANCESSGILNGRNLLQENRAESWRIDDDEAKIHCFKDLKRPDTRSARSNSTMAEVILGRKFRRKVSQKEVLLEDSKRILQESSSRKFSKKVCLLRLQGEQTEFYSKFNYQFTQKRLGLPWNWGFVESGSGDQRFHTKLFSKKPL